MKVLHVFRKLDPTAWGGTEMAMQRMFEGLRAQGVEPVVYCPRLGDGEATPEDPLVKAGYAVRRYRAFVPVLGLRRERKRQLVAVGGNLMSFDLVTGLWRERDVKVMHAHSLGRIGGIALTIAKQRRLPFVVSVHGGVLDLPEPLKEAFNAPNDSGWEWGKLFGLLFQSHRLFVDADAILTCNAREARLLQERYPEKRVMVQAHGVPVQDYQVHHRELALAGFPEIRGRKLLLCLGRIDPVKNQGWVLEQAPALLSRHPTAVLVLAGACTDEPYGEKLRRRISELGLAGRVLLTGGLPPNDKRLIGLLQEAALLILPSLSETFGLVILEAWAAGTPVLCSKTSGAMALVRDGENGWLFDLGEERAATFHARVDEALLHPQRARGMAALGREKVEQEYSVTALARQLRALYESLQETPLAPKSPQPRQALPGRPGPKEKQCVT